MIENIDRVLERGERIELLVDKTDRLSQNARKFEKSVKSLASFLPLCSSANVLIYYEIDQLIEECYALSKDKKLLHRICSHCGKLGSHNTVYRFLI